MSRDGAAVYAVSSAGLVVAIDPATYRVTAVAQPARNPPTSSKHPMGRSMSPTPVGTVSVYQAAGLTLRDGSRSTGCRMGCDAAAGGSVIVVANTMDGALDLIDPATDTYVGAVPVGSRPAQVAVTSDGQVRLHRDQRTATVVKVDLAQRKVVAAPLCRTRRSSSTHS